MQKNQFNYSKNAFPQSMHNSGNFLKENCTVYAMAKKSNGITTSKRNKSIFPRKKYLLQLKDDLLHEKRAIEFYLRHHKERPWKSEQLLTSESEFQKLLLPFFKPPSKEFEDWANSPYSQNQNYPNQLNYKAPNGQLVRSKSEMLIAMTLYKYQIPFRYECALQLGATTIHPDFTIRHPQTGEFYYLEHFGMIDNPAYRQNAIHKLNTYLSHEIYPTINLITTYETKTHPLNLELVESIIQLYFL